MGGKVPNYQIVYRDETLNYFKPGGYVFFQRLKEYGGGYWLGKIYEDGFEFVLERPTSFFYPFSLFLFCQFTGFIVRISYPQERRAIP